MLAKEALSVERQWPVTTMLFSFSIRLYCSHYGYSFCQPKMVTAVLLEYNWPTHTHASPFLSKVSFLGLFHTSWMYHILYKWKVCVWKECIPSKCENSFFVCTWMFYSRKWGWGRQSIQNRTALLIQLSRLYSWTSSTYTIPDFLKIWEEI